MNKVIASGAGSNNTATWTNAIVGESVEAENGGSNQITFSAQNSRIEKTLEAVGADSKNEITFDAEGNYINKSDPM